MAQSFSATETGALAESDHKRRRVLVTGAAGNIGSYFAAHSHEKYELILMERKLDEATEKIKGFGELMAGDITDLERMKTLCEGVDTVVHLAADPSPNAP